MLSLHAAVHLDRAPDDEGVPGPCGILVLNQRVYIVEPDDGDTRYEESDEEAQDDAKG